MEKDKRPTSTFEEGYRDGWQSIVGKGVVPPTPAYALPAGKTPYEHGYEQGRAAAGGKYT